MGNLLERLTVRHVKEAYYSILESIKSNLEAVKRLERAFDILVKDDRYEITYISGNPVTFKVRSPNDEYTVINAQRLCTCPDNQILCKHRLVVSLILNAINLQKKDGISIDIKEVCK